MTITPIDSILGGVLAIVTIRLIGLTLGRQHPCPTMRRVRIVVGALLYSLAFLSIVAGIAAL